jgi:hypothetical protein
MTTLKPPSKQASNGSGEDFCLPEQIYIRDRDPIAKARAIQQCLEYLCYEAEAAQLPLAVHLIGAAAEHLADVVGATAKPTN